MISQGVELNSNSGASMSFSQSLKKVAKKGDMELGQVEFRDTGKKPVIQEAEDMITY